MLSAEERRRLEEIERLLQLDDPRFVARMCAEPKERRKWVPLVFSGALWIIAIVVGITVSWLAGFLVAVSGSAVGGAALAVAVYRRRRHFNTGWTPPSR